MRAASQRPMWPATTSNWTGAPSSMVRVPSAIAVQWNGYSAAVVGADHTEAAGVVERHATTRRIAHQWTIFDSGSSMMSVAPASFSAGINTLISVLGTTVSTA